ncbi:MAG: AraC family transcriptional regulator [Ruminococcaceae bacterium]|nr:AraC family transcriptional regulator [Oscillospiraceae bacterium]
MKNLNEPMKNLDVYPSDPIYEVSTRRWSGDHCYNTHRFFYVKAGAFVLNIGKHTYIVRKGQLAFLPANRPHTYWLSPDSPPKYIHFSFLAYAHGEDFFEHYGFADDHHVVSVPEELIDRCVEQMLFTELGDTNLSHYIIKAAQHATLCAIYARARILSKDARNEFQDVIAFMQEHIAEDLSLDAVAERFHFNPNYFGSKFKKYMGVSPMKYFAEMRAQFAGELLKTTDLSLKEIAARVGFSDIYYFKTFFKKQMGIPPENFKNVFVPPPELGRV